MKGPLVAVPGAFLIAIAAALWGTDALLRKPLAESTEAATIVFGEHLVLVLIMLPVIPAAFAALRRGRATSPQPRRSASKRGRRSRRSSSRRRSCTATLSRLSPLEGAQPLFAVVGAWFILAGERPRPKYGWLLLGGVVGAADRDFPSPFEIHVDKVHRAARDHRRRAWAMGTVLAPRDEAASST